MYTKLETRSIMLVEIQYIWTSLWNGRLSKKTRKRILSSYDELKVVKVKYIKCIQELIKNGTISLRYM